MLTIETEARQAVTVGRLPSNPSLALLTYMADRWLQNEVRKLARRREKLVEKDSTASSSGAYQRKVKALVSQIVQKAQTDWTDLLDQSFSLPDGSQVTWRLATTSDHLQRAEMLEKMGAGVLETAARHREAVALYTAAGGSCLGDIS